MKSAILLGDSIRHGYQGVARHELVGAAEVRGLAKNGTDKRRRYILWIHRQAHLAALQCAM